MFCFFGVCVFVFVLVFLCLCFCVFGFFVVAFLCFVFVVFVCLCFCVLVCVFVRLCFCVFAFLERPIQCAEQPWDAEHNVNTRLNHTRNAQYNAPSHLENAKHNVTATSRTPFGKH